MRRLRIGDRKYDSYNAFVRPHDRWQHVGYEIIGKSGLIFWQGWRFMFVGAGGSRENQPKGEESGALEVSFVRGMWNPDKLVEEAINLYNEFTVSGFQKRRFRVRRAYGTFGKGNNQGGDSPKAMVTEEERSEPSLSTMRLTTSPLMISSDSYLPRAPAINFS